MFVFDQNLFSSKVSSKHIPFSLTSPSQHDTTKPQNLLCRQEASPRKYDEWAGNPKGIPEDKTRCVAEVTDFTGWHSLQCQRKRGFGPNGEYCRQHAKKFTEKSCEESK